MPFSNYVCNKALFRNYLNIMFLVLFIVRFSCRGSFSITREKNQTNLGILAHLSRKACSKVSDMAIMLPPELVAEVLAKRRVWPKSFQNVPPTDGSIDLFFFPEYERYCYVDINWMYLL